MTSICSLGVSKTTSAHQTGYSCHTQQAPGITSKYVDLAKALFCPSTSSPIWPLVQFFGSLSPYFLQGLQFPVDMSYLVCSPQISILLEVHFAFSQIPNCYITAAKRDSSAARRPGVGRGGCKGRTGARSRDFENSLFGLTQYVIIMRRDQQPFKHQTHLLFSHQFALFLQIRPFLSAVPLYGLIYSISLLPSLLTSQFLSSQSRWIYFFHLTACCPFLKLYWQVAGFFVFIRNSIIIFSPFTMGNCWRCTTRKNRRQSPAQALMGLKKKGLLKESGI